MLYIERLRQCSDLHSLAWLLGYQPKSLAYLVYHLPKEERYRSFEIPKANGSTRLIKAPHSKLKRLQRIVAKYLANCLLEIENNNPIRRNLAHGFVSGRSIITNANGHKKRSYVFNIDLEDFFPSIHFHRVRGFFIKNRDFSLQPKVATILAQICCDDNQLPQGAPTSPIVSNLIGHILDVRLTQLAKKSGGIYTRYADDITFSTNLKDFPALIALKKGKEWHPSDTLLKEIERCGFRINRDKSRMSHYMKRQSVTGLVVNDVPNVPAEYYRQVRAMVNQLYSTGAYYLAYRESRLVANKSPICPAWLQKVLRWLGFGQPSRSEILSYAPGRIDRLEGKIHHILSVDIASTKLNREDVVKKEYYLNNPGKKFDINELNLEYLLTPGKLSFYSKFEFFKNFVLNDQPTIICEGKTDVTYMRYAFRRRANIFPKLAAAANSKLLVNFFRITGRSGDVLGIRGGADHFPSFIKKYKDNYERYKFKGKKEPVIIVIDNDDGGSKSFGVVRAWTRQSISTAVSADFYNIYENLYVVVTPPLAGGLPSCSEDFFDAATLAKEIDGKTFDRSNNYNPASHYGKADFAEKVIKSNWRATNFSGFDPLLNRISKAIDHQRGKA